MMLGPSLFRLRDLKFSKILKGSSFVCPARRLWRPGPRARMRHGPGACTGWLAGGIRLCLFAQILHLEVRSRCLVGLGSGLEDDEKFISCPIVPA